MAISFRAIPANLRVPLAYFEFDPSLAGVSTTIQNALLLCSVPATATLPIGVPTLITSADQARSLAGPGSALGRQCERFFQNTRGVPLYALAAAQPTTAPLWTAGTATITWGGPATESGVVALYIGGRSVRVIVSAGDTDEEMSAAAVSAINASQVIGVSAAIDGTDPEITNLTALQLGVLGNLRIDHSLAGIVGGEQLPQGVTVTPTQMTGAGAGTGSPNVATMLAGIGDAPFDFVLCPWTTADDLNALRDFFNDTTGRWSWQSQLYGHGFCAAQGTIAQLSAIGAARNDQHVCIFGYNNSATPHDEWMAAYAGQAAGSLVVDPARPVHGLPLYGILAPPVQSRFTKTELQVLYFTGIASYDAETGIPQINRCVTTYRVNQWNAPDDSMLDVETLYSWAAFARFMRGRILLKFPRHKLASDGTRFGAGQAVVTPIIIRSELIAAYGELTEPALVENEEAFEENLIVERNAQDRNRVDVLLPATFVAQLRIFAALVQPRMHIV